MWEPSMTTSLVSGGLAGIAMDLSLFPLDTIKTRLQSQQGFWTAGGFRSTFSGIGPTAVGSAPHAALFFLTYDSFKKVATRLGHEDTPVVHMAAASCGKVVACVVRVPTEILKQRRQARIGGTALEIFKHTIKTEGIRGMYRGYLTTVFREVPFSLIQFPLWEFLRKCWSNSTGESPTPWQSSLCGAVSGGVSAAITTPLDVAKTRIMLATAESEEANKGMIKVMKGVFAERGVGGLFSGVIPRVAWISIGGAVFFGVYEQVKDWMSLIEKR